MATILAHRRQAPGRNPISYAAFCPFATVLDHARADSNPAGAISKRLILRAFFVVLGVAWHRCGTDVAAIGPAFSPIALATTRPRTASSRSACARCIASIAWMYVFAVIAIVEWPRAVEIVFKSAPAASESVACEWRRSWRRTLGSFARRMSAANDHENESGFHSEPSARSNT